MRWRTPTPRFSWTEAVDVVAILIGLVVFASMFLILEGLDRV